ncbi:MAG: SIS domain-containing protein [Anaerovibrio sp.]|uniref:D-sedoheptulose-7-phosphate isomerase n=1 Tax=Anaerovibrio sp. TaxID=1872532 RepID=UPI0025EB39B9|nr:SIS domain-containing protein [Anaerovibrio sp.]MCR5176291.1 SIS domain-containing protein [Anaerovibrio sp.]
MKKEALSIIDDLIIRYPVLSNCRTSFVDAAEAVCTAYHNSGKLLVCGNGGSASDAEHIVGELMKGFILKRPIDDSLYEKMKAVCPKEADYLQENLQGALPAISLMNAVALNSAFANDQAPDLSMAQQVLGLGNEGDVLLGISTSGNSANVIYAVQMARVKGIKTIGLLGGRECRLKDLCDISICVPEQQTYKIQELHLPVYHMLCMAVEREFFDK